jgi:secreted Zn-dependent insulinase-like peptidase
MENEFAGVLSSDIERLDRMQAVTALPGHPAGKFAWGDKQSLWIEPQRDGLDVQQLLTQHCREYCGAQNLLVVALGTQSLNKLEKMVRKTFGTIPRALKDAPDYSNMSLPFPGMPSLPEMQPNCAHVHHA